MNGFVQLNKLINMKTISNSLFLLIMLLFTSTIIGLASNTAAPPPVYCASNGNSQYWEYIDYVAIGTISRISGPETGGYFDGSAMSTDLVAGSTYTFSFSHANPHGGYVEDWTVYIDWNADGDFDDAGEKALIAVTYTSVNYNYSITVPATASIGATRMRVSMRFYNYPPPCGTFSQGEVEDYTLNILSGNLCSESYEPNNTKGTANALAVNTPVLSQISSATDVDWYSFYNTAVAPNIKVDLTNLPANFDLRLFDPSGVNVMTAKHSGTTDETILYNTAVVGKYKIKVNGRNGAFSNTLCYTLQANISDVPFRLSPVETNGSISEMSLYPNPASGELTIHFINDNELPFTISVMNMLGELVYTKTESGLTGNSTATVDVSKMPDGIYLIMVKCGAQTITNKFMVAQ